MSQTNLVYNVQDKPAWGKTMIFALQQLLAILAATIAVPAIVGHGMSPSAALFGAGAGTLVYLLFTKFKSPVFLGSSFSFLSSMGVAFAGAATMATGYLGLIIGAVLAGLVYVALSFVVKFAGTKWIDKIMPAVVIGPTVAIIGLSLAGNAVGDLFKGNFLELQYSFDPATGNVVENMVSRANWMVCLLCGMVTLFTTIIISVFGKKTLKMIPFVIGIAAGYVTASIFTGIGYACGGSHDGWKIIDFGKFASIEWYPNFSFLQMFTQGKIQFSGGYFLTILVAYVPVAFVVFAEHIADHKNLSTIIGNNLLEDPGLNRTLLGDGIGSMAGAFFGGCPNTTYGESIGAVAISGNASIRTIFVTALMAIVLSFIGPFATFLSSIPPCVMGGVCIALYGFIAVSGLKMVQKVDLNDNRNLFVVSVILIAGVGGLSLTFFKGTNYAITITEVACALVLGIIVNLIVNIGKKKEEPAAELAEAPAEEAAPEEEPAEQPEEAPVKEPAEEEAAPEENAEEEQPAEESEPEAEPEAEEPAEDAEPEEAPEEEKPEENPEEK